LGVAENRAAHDKNGNLLIMCPHVSWDKDEDFFSTEFPHSFTTLVDTGKTIVKLCLCRKCDAIMGWSYTQEIASNIMKGIVNGVSQKSK